MKISEIRETSKEYYFLEDCNELHIKKEKIGDVMVKIKNNFINYVWLYKTGDVMNISVTVDAKKLNRNRE